MSPSPGRGVQQALGDGGETIPMGQGQREDVEEIHGVGASQRISGWHGFWTWVASRRHPRLPRQRLAPPGSSQHRHALLVLQQAEQVSNAAGLHLGHHAAPMLLNRLEADAQIERDHFVGFTK